MSSVEPDRIRPEFDRIRMVLVNTSHPGNIGAAARAIKNMGLSRLVLVAPKDFPADQAQWRAAGALDVLEKAVVVETLDEAIADCRLVVGTSARGRRIPWPLVSPRECGDKVYSEAKNSEHEVAILFGREDRGLTNEELHKCQYHVHIPANPGYSSLNIAAALQVIVYEIRMSALAAEAGQPISFDEWDMPPAAQQDIEHYFEHLQKTLETLGFLEVGNPRQTLTRLRRLYGRVRPDQMELNILRGVLTATQNYVYHSNNKIADLEREIEALKAASKPAG
ncbi:tRNA (cytosine(32)/uridine(32)-2'-O)-methyltransferase TrmJ [Marinagarivorans cellulosilyticus]|uniref:tRNA (cytidine/uridine-2'-O-)-methyltransferase TrmJ n=1 Tax=Marinagarivorans cellulosilyticus TaxID=2721545 RepID=A0AAN1WFE4_9GAMM|nr:tRNA (cytosine(32)/uridine(32)-2'-O)-methyltransferase TrmJ [Marinagarivorans cellulosilyticus]BCD96581.1 tRNA (cytidine32/uridine32-2'-O)-methyltransferase [Marinagarivorans cellulosilyticus]